jgi:hypothetical protein
METFCNAIDDLLVIGNILIGIALIAATLMTSVGICWIVHHCGRRDGSFVSGQEPARADIVQARVIEFYVPNKFAGRGMAIARVATPSVTKPSKFRPRFDR